ncbi:MAG TPA: hypothetical protein VHG28_21425 [Longimicrobiaceae bacterium]|nr:hypothetical protein [Longimicrobiaceae bacterium]
MKKSRVLRGVAGRASGVVALLLALAACEEAQGVDVQPLPPLRQPSPEARVGLPEVAGAWRFAGWELPLRDTVTRGEGLVPPGILLVRTQRLDSIAGAYLREGQEYPFVGEVRRDGVLSGAAFGPDGSGSFIAGQVRKDTLWIELTSLTTAAGWSPGTHAAMVRGRVGTPFVRFQGGWVPPRPDSVIRDSIRRADSLRMADSLRRAVPGAVVPPTTTPLWETPVTPPPTAVPPRQPPQTERPREDTVTGERPKRSPERPPRRRTPPPEERDTAPRREPEPEPRPDTTRPPPVIVP